MFCKKFSEVNGPEACIPNMHMHLHIKDCLCDYGPIYAFWCYAFECYNGMLGGFPTNHIVTAIEEMPNAARVAWSRFSNRRHSI